MNLLKFAIGPWHFVLSQAHSHYSQWEKTIPLGETQDTVKAEHLQLVTVPTIVTVEVPSQASEGKFDSLPNQIESFSPLPEGTSLAPT